MVSTTVLRFLLVLVASFLFGLLFYYVMDREEKLNKKKRIDEVISLTIHIIICIWIGKILANFQLFMKDPLAILSYPSDRRALYIALLLVSIYTVYETFKKKRPFRPIWNTFIPVLLGTLFMYELLQIIVEKNTYYFYYIIIYTILLLLYILLERYPHQLHIVIYSWFSLQIICWYYLGSIRLFHYMVSPIFIGLLCIIYSGYIVLEKKVSEG
ncbi:hypothetical protein [Pseudogracilibacillus sp. ICA-222130]|uniref:hypothetical protein n=1 Tax=Pseudogracilibacillus sp. ICA-222130 TaxID=3134655 RepID=UPI0030C44C14